MIWVLSFTLTWRMTVFLLREIHSAVRHHIFMALSFSHLMAWRQVLWSPGPHGETANKENTAFERPELSCLGNCLWGLPLWMWAFQVSIVKSTVNVEIMFLFHPNAFFKAAIERKFESVPTAFYVNRILNCERIGTPEKKKKGIVRRKKINMLSVFLLVTVKQQQT